MSNANNMYKNKRIEFHILQSFPVTCLNRDDVGAPKTAVVGGVTRARVSSQCWKRAIRMAMHEISGVHLGSRTKALADLISTECKKLGATDEQAQKCGDKIQNLFGSDKKIGKLTTLLFLSPFEIEKICNGLKNVDFTFDNFTFKDKNKKNKETKVDNAEDLSKFLDYYTPNQKKILETLDGLDIALFGRMVAQAPTMDVEAAASFNHAISTHKVANEIEFFTALDDYSDNQGSAHMGTLEFNAATYYRYVSLDLGQLYETLGESDDFFPQAIEAFVKALYVAVPSARQTSQAGSCLWDYAKILVRKGQGLQLSFETPVKAKDGGFLQPSKERLKDELAKKEKLSGSLFGKIAEYEFGDDENFSIDNLISAVVESAKA